jgi:hypothetical protein
MFTAKKSQKEFFNRLLETLTARYRCNCLMIVSPRSRPRTVFTRIIATICIPS